MQENPAKVPEERQADYQEMYLVMARHGNAWAHRSPAALRGTVPAVHGGVAPVPRQLHRRLGTGRAGEASPPVVRGRWSLQEDRRGRPVCRPVSGSRAEVPGRTHRSAPTRGGRYSEPTENGAKTDLANGADRFHALYGCNRAGRSTAGCAWGVASASQIRNEIWGVSQGPPALRKRHRWCGNGPMYLRHGFRRPNFVPKFGASVIVIGLPCGGREGRGMARRVVVLLRPAGTGVWRVRVTRPAGDEDGGSARRVVVPYESRET